MDNVMEGQLTENKQEFTEPELESLRRKYKAQDGRIYEVTTTIQEDDEEETKSKSWGQRQNGRRQKTSGVEAAFYARNPGLKND